MTDDFPTPDPQPPDGPLPEQVPHADANGPPSPPHDEEKPAETPEAPTPSNKHWYVVKVQSGREESIKDAVERRVKIEGLHDYFGQIIIPVEKVTEMRNGKR